MKKLLFILGAIWLCNCSPILPIYAQTTLDFVKVQGNQFINEAGETIIFKGVNIADPAKLVKDEKWSKHHFEMTKKWGANLVRLPVHPRAWRETGEEAYLELLDQAVSWAKELNLYLIIDWHSIGNLRAGLYQHPRYYTTQQETLNFWKTIAERYTNNPVIAFYEIFNEPTTFNGKLGQISWEEWKAINEEIIDLIYAYDTTVIPLVTGFNWGYDLSPIRTAPIDRTGIGYVSHPYPQKVKPPYEEKWEDGWGYVADTYPLICTEFGFMAAQDKGAHIPCISDESYGTAIINYFHKKGISYTVWCFDPDWTPSMISDWNYTPTRQGTFFREALLGKLN